MKTYTNSFNGVLDHHLGFCLLDSTPGGGSVGGVYSGQGLNSSAGDPEGHRQVDGQTDRTQQTAKSYTEH